MATKPGMKSETKRKRYTRAELDRAVREAVVWGAEWAAAYANPVPMTEREYDTRVYILRALMGTERFEGQMVALVSDLAQPVGLASQVA
jgi:hypothetical protein